MSPRSSFPPPAATLRPVGEAVMSADGVYRYVLRREWGPGPMVTWIMLNPSTADANTDDATIRTIMGFSRRWGMGNLAVVNLYAFRSRDPKALVGAEDPVGPDNWVVVDHWMMEADVVVVGWGAHAMPGMAEQVATLRRLAALGGVELQCIGTNANGSPMHPLMRSHSLPLVPWS